MSTTTDTDVDNSVLESLDFAPRCESVFHERHYGDEPASWFVSSACPNCGEHKQGFRCNYIVVLITSHRCFQCVRCNQICDLDTEGVIFKAQRI